MVEESVFSEMPSGVSADEEILIFAIGPHGTGSVVVRRTDIAHTDAHITTNFRNATDPTAVRTHVVNQIASRLHMSVGADAQSVRLFNEAAAMAAWIASEDAAIQRDGRVDWVVYGVFGEEFLLALGRGDEGYEETRNQLVDRGAALYAGECPEPESRTLH